ncbi:MAG: porin [Rhodococcus sp.]|nr:porin [Rhodococcus sp. (in: high G+C Gram-positive bacteria)]
MRTLFATTAALALAGSAALAEVTIGADARFNISHDSESEDAIGVHQRFRVHFDASGVTDAGLTFSGGAIADSSDGKVDDGVVSVSGAFGTLAFGAKDAADVLAGGIADVGMVGVGVDNVAEDELRNKTDPGDLILYTHSLGDISVAVSGAPGTGGTDDMFAVGMSFTAADIRIGFGYDSEKTMSLGGSYTFGQITANAYYAERDNLDGTGIDLSYGIGATTLTLVAATNSQDQKAAGLGVSHDLGGGASMVAGFGQIPGENGADKSGAEVGLSFTF